MKKLILLMLGILLVLPLISAQPLIFQKEADINLKIPVSIDGSIVSGSASCDINIKYPNGSYMLKNESMSNLFNGEFEVNITGNNNSQLGNHPYSIFCVDGNYNGTASDKIIITGSGQEVTTAQGIIYVVVFIASLFILSLTLFGAFKIQWKNSRDGEGKIISINDLKFVKIFLMFMAYIELMWIAFLLRNITRGFLAMDGAGMFFNFIFWLFLAFLLPIWIGFLVFSLILFLENKKLKAALMRGLPI